MTTEQSRDHLVLEHYDMVQRIARRMASRYPSYVEVDDLVSIGTMGLLDAAERYDPTMSTPFAAYARIRIQGAIVDALRQLDWVPRTVRNRNRSLSEATERLTLAHGRAPTNDELAADLGIASDHVDNFRRDSAVLGLVSMSEQRPDSDQCLGETLASSEPGPDAPSINDAVRSTVIQAIGQLPERDQRIVRHYYYEGLSFKQIGERLGVTESRVSQLHSRIKRRLRAALDGADLAMAA